MARSSSSGARTPSLPPPAQRRIARRRRPPFTSRAVSPSRALPMRIRVNVVNPDAVIRGSRIWSGAWRSRAGRQQPDRGGGGRGVLPRPQPAQAQRVSRGRRGGGPVLRVGSLGQVNGKHPERRRRQRDGVHTVGTHGSFEQGPVRKLAAQCRSHRRAQPQSTCGDRRRLFAPRDQPGTARHRDRDADHGGDGVRRRAAVVGADGRRHALRPLPGRRRAARRSSRRWKTARPSTRWSA